MARPSINALRWFIAFLVTCLLFQLTTLLVRPAEDSAAWLFMGQRQESGQMPGRDLWDNKLPLIYLVGRAAMRFGQPECVLWLLESALTAAAALAGAAIVARVTERRAPALGAGLLLCVLSGVPVYRGEGFAAEVYALSASAAAAFLTLRRAGAPRLLVSDIAAGVLWALAVSFRLPLALAAGAVLVSAAAVRAASARGDAIVRASAGAPVWGASTFAACLGAHVAGGVLGAAIVLAHPVLGGYLMDCIRAAVLWPLGLTGPHVSGPATPTAAERLADVGVELLKLSWLHAAALAGFVVAWRRGRRGAVLPLCAWYAGAVLSTAAGWASFAHYHYVAFGPAAVGVGLLADGVRGRWRLAPLAVGVAALVLAISQNVRLLVRRAGQGDDAERAALLAYLSVSTAPRDSVLLWVWGRDADLLYRLNRPPGVRHFLAHSYLDMDMTLFDEFALELAARPPERIVTVERRGMPHLLGAGQGDAAGAIPRLQALRAAISPHYVEELKCGRFVVWKRLEPGRPSR